MVGLFVILVALPWLHWLRFVILVALPFVLPDLYFASLGFIGFPKPSSIPVAFSVPLAPLASYGLLGFLGFMKFPWLPWMPLFVSFA